MCVLPLQGVDYTHPLLGGGFGPEFKVVGGYDFVGDEYGPGKEPAPDKDPNDCVSNGKDIHPSDGVFDIAIARSRNTHCRHYCGKRG